MRLKALLVRPSVLLLHPLALLAPVALLTSWVGAQAVPPLSSSAAALSSAVAVVDTAAWGKLQRVNELVAVTPEATTQVRSFGSLLFQTGLALALVLALLGVVVFLLKRFSQRNNLPGSQGGIELLESVQIAPGHRIAILRIYEQQIVVSISAEGVRHLVDLSTASEGARFEAPKPATQFSMTVDQMLQRFRRPGAVKPVNTPVEEKL